MANGGIVGYKEKGKVEDKTDLPTTDVEYSASQKKQKEKDREKQAEEEALLIMAANNPQPPTAAEPTPPPMDVAPAPTPAVAPPMDVAPTPSPAVAPPMDVAPAAAPITVESAMGDYQKALPAAQKEADMTIDERMAQQQALEDKYLGKDVATADYMKSVMDEKANAPDEARRQMGMRLMEFGANWAGTPGAPLVAGMRALKDTLPGVMEDTKENKKVMKEIDKTIYMLQHATRLEDAGKLEKASAEKEKASAKVMALKTPLVEFAMKRQDQLNEQEYRTETLKLKEKEMNQSASQAAAALKQSAANADRPTEAGMKQAAIDAYIKEGKSPTQAYALVEAAGRTSTDPRLGYEVQLTKTRYNTATKLMGELALFPESQAYLDAKTEAEDALAKFKALQTEISAGAPAVDLSPLPSGGPRVDSTKSNQSTGIDQDLVNRLSGAK
jgi:hypothetical protein